MRASMLARSLHGLSTVPPPTPETVVPEALALGNTMIALRGIADTPSIRSALSA